MTLKNTHTNKDASTPLSMTAGVTLSGVEGS
jgi:hypothetical protein